MSITGWNDPFDIFFTAKGTEEPKTNVGHNSKEIILQIALPGFSRSEIDLDVNAGRLSIRAKRQSQKSDYEFTTREIGFSDYNRTWSIPKHVNTESVEAEYESGILTVHLPYNQTNRETTRKVEIR